MYLVHFSFAVRPDLSLGVPCSAVCRWNLIEGCCALLFAVGSFMRYAVNGCLRLDISRGMRRPALLCAVGLDIS